MLCPRVDSALRRRFPRSLVVPDPIVDPPKMVVDQILFVIGLNRRPVRRLRVGMIYQMLPACYEALHPYVCYRSFPLPLSVPDGAN